MKQGHSSKASLFALGVVKSTQCNHYRMTITKTQQARAAGLVIGSEYLKMKSGHETILEVTKKLVTELCNYPEHLTVKQNSLTRTTTINIQSHAADMSRIIGVNGQHMYAIRTIASAIGERHGIEVDVPNLVEAKVGTPERYGDFQGSNDWPKAKVLDLLKHRPLQRCRFLKELLGQEAMELLMRRAIKTTRAM